MKKKVRLSDIGAKLGVSTVTVSKAVSGQKGVSDSLREKILNLAQEMGYEPPSKDIKVKKERGFTIGVLIAGRYLDEYDSFYLQMYRQVSERAISKSCFAVMEQIDSVAEKQLIIPSMIKEEKVDGIIVLGKLAWNYLDFLNENSPVPLIYLDFCDKKKESDAVISDSYYGAYRLTEYLFDMGHTRIGYVGTLLATESITDRYMGYLRSLMEHGQDVNPEWIIADRECEQGTIDSKDYLKLPKNLPTAFVCNCDMTACRLIKKLKTMGLNVPEDISVVGYDNYIHPGLCDVGITTYEVDVKEMARKAVHVLVKKMAGEDYRERINIVEGRLVIKDSVKERKSENGTMC